MLHVLHIHRAETKRDVWHFVKVKLHQHRETGEHTISVVGGDRRNSAAEGSTVKTRPRLAQTCTLSAKSGTHSAAVPSASVLSPH